MEEKGNLPPPPESKPAISHLERNWARVERPSEPAVRVGEGKFRFVYAIDSNAVVTQELFEPGEDPLEMNNIAEEQPEVTEHMMQIVERYMQSEPAPWGVETPEVEVDQMERNQLRALGYAIP